MARSMASNPRSAWLLAALALVALAADLVAAPRSRWVAVASHAAGVGGSVWRTDLFVRNDCATATSAEVRFQSATGVASIVVDVPAKGQLVLEDVVTRFTTSDATGAIEVIASAPLAVGSRTFNAAASGTFGQEMAAVLPDQGLDAGGTATLPQLREDSAFRSNLGFLNMGTLDALVGVRLFDSAGAEVGAYTLSLPAGRLLQDGRPFANRFGRSDIASGHAIIEVTRGAGIFAYASVVDNRTGDPTTVVMDAGTLQLLPADARAVVAGLIAGLPVAAGSTVYLAGPVDLGSTVHDAAGAPSPTLSVPGSGGPFWVAMVDADATLAWQHPVTWVVINATSGARSKVAATSRLAIAPPARTAVPFVPRWFEVVSGVEVFRFEGDGAPTAVDVSHKVEALVDGDRSLTRPNRAPVSHAIVADAGDIRWVKFSLGFLKGDKSNVSSVAAGCAKSADKMQTYLSDNGFTVTRTSQYWGNSYPRLTSAKDLIRLIKSEGTNLTALGAPDGGECDNFFFYAHGHGGFESMEFYKADGSGLLTENGLYYQEILQALSNFPSWAKVTIFIDACFSGTFFDAALKPAIEAACAKLCALTIITTTDADTMSTSSSTAWDSATEDFLEWSVVDYDGDGTTGDIRDRFEMMKREILSKNPQSFHCPECKSWCKLDGPEPKKTACAPMDGRKVQMQVVKVIDPAQHSRFIGDPFRMPIRFAVGCPAASAEGTAPFVATSGTTREGSVATTTGLAPQEISGGVCGMIGAGSGTVAGFPNVDVLLDGVFASDGTFSGTYTMGTDGALPTGQAITYVLSGTPVAGSGEKE